MTKSKRADIIRVNDKVRIVDPRVVTRVGYPKTVNDYLALAEQKYGAQLRADFRGDNMMFLLRKAVRQIAYGLARVDGFGGRERSLHLQEIPALMGQEFTVWEAKMVQTGFYYPPRGGYDSWTNEYDYEPGGLMSMKARRLVKGFSVPYSEEFYAKAPDTNFWTFGDRLWIPVEHLEKL